MTDGVCLKSTSHPIAPWWKRLWLRLFHRDIDPKALETVKTVKLRDACDMARQANKPMTDIDRIVFENLCRWREIDHMDNILLTRNEVCSILEHCRRNGVKIP